MEPDHVSLWHERNESIMPMSHHWCNIRESRLDFVRTRYENSIMYVKDNTHIV